MKRLLIMIKHSICGFLLLIFIVPASDAVMLSADGSGQVLIFPYYTVRGGHDSIFSITNSSSYIEAVRLRFRSADDGAEVLSFNAYIPPHGAFAFALTMGLPIDTSK